VHWRDDQFPAPLDPNFLGVGRCSTGADGVYRFTTIRPGAYPWGNHPNAWRPPHIHFSLMGPSLGSRLVTQMYFPGDPLLAFDPIYNSAPEHSRERMVAVYDPDVTEDHWALGYRWDIVLRGSAVSPAEANCHGCFHTIADSGAVLFDGVGASGREHPRFPRHGCPVTPGRIRVLQGRTDR